MRLQTVQEALKKKNISYEYTEEDGCGSLDFMFRGLSFHVWEYCDGGWGAETNVFAAGRSEDIEGDYEEIISREILSWPDMIA
ncbi:MAG: kinase [Blautia sp.]|nr:kinase [Candidatus Blautia excrementigallinarum]